VDPKWSVDSMWTPHGVTKSVEIELLHQVDSMWTSCGLQMESLK
jgi:hypothetical protein